MKSLWAATAPAAPQTPALAESLKVDVAIVGAGYTGLSTALHLAERGVSVCVLEANEPGWVQYAFDQPFTCRSIRIRSKGYNYQAHRLRVEASDDGRTFREVARLHPPRSGWQDSSAVTHALPATTARYFRFQYDPAGSEPGAEGGGRDEAEQEAAWAIHGGRLDDTTSGRGIQAARKRRRWDSNPRYPGGVHRFSRPVMPDPQVQ